MLLFHNTSEVLQRDKACCLQIICFFKFVQTIGELVYLTQKEQVIVNYIFVLFTTVQQKHRLKEAFVLLNRYII